VSDVAKVLNGAADLIEQRGWCTGTFQDASGRVSVAAAINQVVYAQPGSGRWRLYKAAYTALLAHVGLPSHALLSTWNDRQSDAEPVVAALRAAAQEALATETTLDLRGRP
jgi:hypothetical protein